MSFFNRHFLDFSHLTKDDIYFLFNKAENFAGPKALEAGSLKKSVGLLFLEASTRTICSFELAAQDCGYIPLKFDVESSSLKKGESILDTLLTLKAMDVSAFVVRHGLNISLRELSKSISIPMINAGEGVSGHPTQALLDSFTILKNKKQIQGEKVLIIGDVKYSRVAQSNLDLLTMLGAEVAYCGPEALLPNNSQKRFKTLEEGMAWASVLMALRPQLERHTGPIFEEIKKDFVKKYSLNKDRLSRWKPDGLILHPGPFIREQEITSDVLQDSRCKIWEQVNNGRLIRRALLALILGDL